MRVEGEMTGHSSREASGGLASERGAILIQVAIAMIVLIAFTSFVADYGLLWVGRRQAQNAADAGALAGAVALAFDHFGDRTATGPAKQSAHNFALANSVLREAPDNQIDTDVLFYPDDPSKFPDECEDDSCVRVDVYRNQERGNALPTWFGQLVGITEQGVRATAIARAAFGNASDCLKPWAVVDRWWEYWEDGAPVPQTGPNPWDFDSNFDKYDSSGNLDPAITTPDVYTPASVQYDGDTPLWGTYTPGTGFHPFTFNGDGSIAGYTSDYGMQVSLKMGDAGDWNFGAGWFMRLNLCPLIDREAHPDAPDNAGADCYKYVIKNCVGALLKIGDEIEIDNNPGSASGPTRDAVGGPNVGASEDADSLYNQDPTAYWDQTLKGGLGGVANSKYPVSPRIVAIPLVNPDALMEAFKNGRTTVPISNIAGFFVEGVKGNGVNQRVIGRLMTMPGLKTEGGATGGAPSTFTFNISLIR
jgi:Flp pilus assembly protein TadG